MSIIRIIIYNKKLSYRRDSASATHVFLGSLTDRALHWTHCTCCTTV